MATEILKAFDKVEGELAAIAAGSPELTEALRFVRTAIADGNILQLGVEDSPPGNLDENLALLRRGARRLREAGLFLDDLARAVAPSPDPVNTVVSDMSHSAL